MTGTDSGRKRDDAALAKRYEAIAPQYGFLIRRALQSQCDDERLTIPQFRTLQTLQSRDVPGATNLELARRISVSPPAMTAMIDGLVERGYVTRTVDPANRRQVVILLTESGSDQLDACAQAIENEMVRGLRHLSDSDAERLSDGLDALEAVFRHIKPPESP